jgi:aldose 1-epimerase
MRPVARLKEPRSGRVMELLADQPGVQFYSGNFLDGSLSGKGAVYRKHSALCLETQAFPNAINVPAWANQVIVPAGGEYEHHMVHRFSAE